MDNILIIDDESTNAKYLAFILKKNGYQTKISYTGRTGLKIFLEDKIDIVFCDFQLPDMNGSDVLKNIKKINSNIPVIIFTGYADVKTAVDVMKLGAFDYLLKPLVLDEVLMVVNKARMKSGLKESKTESRKELADEGAFDETDNAPKYITGSSNQSKYVQKQVQLVAETSYSVIVYGESGTGKESIAQSIHGLSKRKNKPFIAVDCGALQKELSGSELFGHEKGAFTGAFAKKTGQFELANGGTIFLDEIGNLSYEIQTSLLRAIQERKIRRLGSHKEIAIDVRIIVASNKNLTKLVDEGRFREDLYHRLNVFSINLHPLRERKEDLSIFIDHFLKLVNTELGKDIEGFTDDAYDIMLKHKWPGNLRELNNVIRRAALLTEKRMIEPNCLPPDFITHSNSYPAMDSNATEINVHELLDKDEDLRSTADRIQGFKIKQTLKLTNNNKSKAARILGIDRKTLYNKIKEYNIKV